MKVGDRVKVTEIKEDSEGYNEYSKYVGIEGVVDRILTNADFPIGIKINGIKLYFKEDELSVNIQYPPINAIVKIKDIHLIENIRGCVGRVVDNDGGVIFENENANFHTLCGKAPFRRGYWVNLDEVDIIGVYEESKHELKKEENMNDELERVIREGNMAIKLVGSVKASPTTIAYTEDITSTLGTLKKKDKRVGFVSTPLKNTI